MEIPSPMSAHFRHKTIFSQQSKSKLLSDGVKCLPNYDVELVEGNGKKTQFQLQTHNANIPMPACQELVK